jgi:hypothetical protein
MGKMNCFIESTVKLAYYIKKTKKPKKTPTSIAKCQMVGSKEISLKCER